MEIEEPLSGGNMNRVTRIGQTVRRSAGPWSVRVHELLAHLNASGIDEVPVPLGFDETGREILSYIPGLVGHYPLAAELRVDTVLISAARLLRRMHDATADVAQKWLSGWQAPVRQPVKVICHGDFAPYNCIFDQGKLAGVIDFDFAHPGSRAWDLAYALYRFAPITAPSNPEGYGTLAEQCRRARLMCDAYGLEDRANLLTVIKARLQSMADFLRQGAQKGDPRMLANIAEGHLAIYTADLAYVEEHEEELERVLGSG